jgi:hypothetical protein
VGNTVTFRVAVVGAFLAGGFSSVTASNAATAEPRPVSVGCLVPAGAAVLGHYGSIGNQQNGETICLVLGGKLLVSLSAPMVPRLEWQGIVASPAGILTPAPTPSPLRRGATSAGFLARRPGVVTLSSNRRACPSAGAGTASCDTLVSWKVTVVVHGPQRAIPQPLKVVPQPVFSAN